MNGWDIALIAAVAILAGLAVWSLIRKKRKGGGCCGDCCGCAGCRTENARPENGRENKNPAKQDRKDGSSL